MNKVPRVLIIGLDGGTFDLINPWVKEGMLPNIARLMHSGTYGNLHSTIPPMTFPAWNSFMTGKNSGKHGLFDFMRRKPGTYELEIMNAQHRKSETIWEIASRYKKKCAVMGVPVTYPPEEINGLMISGFDAPFLDEKIMYPEELFTELEENVGQYMVSANFVKKYLKRGYIDKALEAYCHVIDRKADTAKYILKREQWDLFMIVFGETDAAMHHFWKYHDKNSPLREKKINKNPGFDPIFEIYNRVDKHIGEILEMASEDTTVILMSDHGAGGTGDKVIYLNRFLELNGLLRFKNLYVKTYINKWLNELKSSIRVFLPKKWLKYLRFNPKGMGLKWESKLRFSFIDWVHTKVYAEETPYHPNLRVNLEGREPDGIVKISEYRDLIKKTIELLNEWKNPETGDKIVQKAYTKEELYHGDYIDNSPDILISWNTDKGYSYLFRHSFESQNSFPIEKMSRKEIEKSDYMLNRSGSHRDEGIFVIAGKQIDTGASIDNVEIIDIAPTVLYLLGIPIPVDMDGRVIEPAIKEEYLKTNPVRYDHGPIKSKEKDRRDSTYSDEETSMVERTLKSLGYME